MLLRPRRDLGWETNRLAVHEGVERPADGDDAVRALPNWREESHNGSMPNIQVKDVPADTHAVLRQRASAAHQSLQEYLRSRLIAEAARPTVDEVLARAGGRAGGSFPLADAVSASRFDRARH